MIISFLNKKIVLSTLILTLTSCSVFESYTSTNFYVKNNSSIPIKFEITTYKRSITGGYYLAVPFTIKPKDSLLAIQTGFDKETTGPQNWFKEFNIDEVDGVRVFDPNSQENWKKEKNKRGKVFYTFLIAE